MANLDAFSALPIRPRKHARTKLGLLEAAIAATTERSLDDVTIRELCDRVEISEASFFNYFPRKPDLLVYYIQLWSIEMAWYSQRLAQARGGLAAIEEIFAMTADRVSTSPAWMGEIIAGQARMRVPVSFGEVGLAERLLAFPDLEGVADLEGQGLDTLLPPLVEHAVVTGELPERTDRPSVVVALAAIFLGLPVVLRGSPPEALGSAYQTQLRLLWAGIRNVS